MVPSSPQKEKILPSVQYPAYLGNAVVFLRRAIPKTRDRSRGWSAVSSVDSHGAEAHDTRQSRPRATSRSALPRPGRRPPLSAPCTRSHASCDLQASAPPSFSAFCPAKTSMGVWVSVGLLSWYQTDEAAGGDWLRCRCQLTGGTSMSRSSRPSL